MVGSLSLLQLHYHNQSLSYTTSSSGMLNIKPDNPVYINTTTSTNMT